MFYLIFINISAIYIINADLKLCCKLDNLTQLNLCVNSTNRNYHIYPALGRKLGYNNDRSVINKLKDLPLLYLPCLALECPFSLFLQHWQLVKNDPINNKLTNEINTHCQ